MKRRRRAKSPKAAFLPLTMAQLAFASWETIARRTLMMASNTCSAAEYQRMVAEKNAAALETAALLAKGGGRASAASLLAPWHSRATANAKRLRKRKAG